MGLGFQAGLGQPLVGEEGAMTYYFCALLHSNTVVSKTTHPPLLYVYLIQGLANYGPFLCCMVA